MGLQIKQDVLKVLDKSEIDGNQLMLGGGQLDRKLYTDVNKVLVAIGGKWDRSAKAHLFDGDVSEVLEPILETGEYNRIKQDFGQFDSPAGVVDRVIELAEIELDTRVLEPSAGNGNIAVAAVRDGRKIRNIH
ncbi:MAG: hypothetical protein COB78_10720 [Hyphomicrobiales bacterium]|nr:MAG: hypothetical protein COB78_10720 [Hyphomicrobiales bacterium]